MAIWFWNYHAKCFFVAMSFMNALSSELRMLIVCFLLGGWALLQTPATPPILDDTVILTCNIRGNYVASEVRFYKDGSEIRCDGNKELVFSKVTLEDAGLYWCRISWMEKYELHSAQSLPVPVNILGMTSRHVDV